MEKSAGTNNWLWVSPGRQICLKGAAKLDI
jgi:hypothetical protein